MERPSSSRATPLPDELRGGDRESAFCWVLRDLLRAAPEIRAATFVDGEGECIDYCARGDPFAAKVLGAQLRTAFADVRESARRMKAGELTRLDLATEGGTLLVARVRGDLVVAVSLDAADEGACDARVDRLVGDAVDALRAEAGREPAFLAYCGEPLTVQTRAAVGWDYAPSAFELDARWWPIRAVLGRWDEAGGAAGGRLVRFRVRIADDEELTLTFDPSLDRWFLW